MALMSSPERRCHPHRRRGHERHSALRAAGEHDVPELRTVPAHECREEHRLRARAGGPPARRDPPSGRRHSRHREDGRLRLPQASSALDRKSTRLNSSHSQISYAVFCLKKKKERTILLYVRIILTSYVCYC